MDDFCKYFQCDEMVCSSTVLGTPVTFNTAYLAELFKVPNHGYDSYFKGQFNLRIGDASKDQILVSLGGRKGVNKINHNQLSPMNRLLLNFVWRAIIPRAQKRNEANLLDCAIIYCVTNKIPINFPSLMIQHLEYSVSNKFKVGYGALLTTIFQDQNVPMENAQNIEPKPENIVQESTLKNLSLAVVEGKLVNWKEEKAVKVEAVENEIEEAKKVVPESERKSLRIAVKKMRHTLKEKTGSPVIVPLDVENNEVYDSDVEAKDEDAEGTDEKGDDLETTPIGTPAPKQKGTSSGVPSIFASGHGFSGFSTSSTDKLLRDLIEKLDLVIKNQTILDSKVEQLTNTVTNHMEAASSSHQSILQKIDEVAFEVVQEEQPQEDA